MAIADVLARLSEAFGPPGSESEVSKIWKREMEDLGYAVETDGLGNTWGIKPGKSNIKVALVAHADEVGICVSNVDERGFLRIALCGGIDRRILPGQEVVLKGPRGFVYGVVATVPPHIERPKKAPPLEDIVIDVGASSKEEAEHLAPPGTFGVIRRKFKKLLGTKVAGKALDDRAGLCAVYVCAKKLKDTSTVPTVYFMASAQEEFAGAVRTAARLIKPDVAIVVEVEFADPKVPKAKMEFGKVGINLQPDLHPKVIERLKETARKNDIPFRVVVGSRPGGTDAYTIQVAEAPVATGLVSIPLRYMHSSVEIVDTTDIERVGRLLAEFVRDLDESFVRGLEQWT